MNQVVQEVEKVKAEIQEVKKEIQKPAFGVDEKSALKKNDVGENLSDGSAQSIKILGELLTFLRKEKSMSLLMLCRQIEKIEIDKGIAIIYSEDDDIMSLQTNEKYHSEISKFFENKGLGFKIKEKVVEVSEVDELKRLFGKKLIIK